MNETKFSKKRLLNKCNTVWRRKQDKKNQSSPRERWDFPLHPSLNIQHGVFPYTHR